MLAVQTNTASVAARARRRGETHIMFGFILGFVCLVALVARFARRRFGHGCHGGGGRGCHGGGGHGGDERHGCHGGGCHGGGDGGDERHGGGHFARRAQRWLFRRLQTTPGQETVIGEAFTEVTRAMDGMREEGRKTRDDVAAAMRAEPFEQATLDSAFARQNVQIQETQRVLGEALAKVHAVLDAQQRKTVAALLERFGWSRGAMGGAGPYRA